MKKSLVMFAIVFVATALVVGMTGCNTQVHEHTFEEEWSSDSTYHWHKATCEHADEMDGRAEHSFGEWKEVTPATEETEGARKRVCEVCGFVQDGTIPMKDHVHSLGLKHEAVAATCTTDGTVEYYDCGKSTCSAKLDADCKVLESLSVTATGHTEDGGTVTATYVAKGKKVFACTECKAWIRDEDIDMLDPIYAFTETVKVLPSTYSGTNGTSSTYVEFGDFPQSEAAAEITYRPEPEKNGYYVGSDGNYYAKVDSKYFKVEPIKWRVLTTSYDYDGSKGTETAKLLLAENILTGNVPYYYSSTGTRNVTTEKGTTVSGIYPNNYEYSQIRAYLNGLVYYDNSNAKVETYKDAGFLQTAFTAKARDLIKTTYVDNSAASTTDTTGYFSQATSYKCDDTQDKIFLLSENEVTTAGYGFAKYNVYKGDSNGTTSSSRILMTTAYARANNAYQKTTAGYGGSWWLRSPRSDRNNFARDVYYGGSADGSLVYTTEHGVVPALSISF